MTDYRALCARMADELDHYRQLLMDDRRETHALASEARAALAQPEPQGPTQKEAVSLYSEVMAAHDCQTLGEMAEHFARAVLARWGRPAIAPDGPAVSDDREPASVTDQITRQLQRRATVLLIRKVIDQAIRDTASVQWRVADTGEQLVRASDLVAWADHMEKQMAQLSD